MASMEATSEGDESVAASAVITEGRNNVGQATAISGGQRCHMEHTRAPPDLGRKGPGTAAVLGGVPGQKRAASTSSPIGRGSGSPASLFLGGRRTGSPAGLFPDSRGSGSVASVGHGSRPAASLFRTGGGNGTALGFMSGFSFPASSSPASWESAGTSPVCLM